MTRALLAALAAFSLIATSCGGAASDTPATSAQAPDSASGNEQSSESSLVASTIDGEQINFGSLEGQDVVLWFWAPW